MDLIEQLQNLSVKISKTMSVIETEEATKQAFIIPFISFLGYDVFDPTEVIPELSADYGTKKGEKVDYAIMREGKPIMIFECKSCHSNLDNFSPTQLFRYFSVTPCKVAIFTNGITYRFYTDLDETNKLDETEFLEINMLDIQESAVNELKMFTKHKFNAQDIQIVAGELKYTKLIQNYFKKQFKNPSDEFVRFITSQVYNGKLMQSVLDKFSPLVKKSYDIFVNQTINDRLKSIMNKDVSQLPTNPNLNSEMEVVNSSIDNSPKIVTTEEELEAFFIIKAIFGEVGLSKKVSYKDTVNYLGIIYDGSRTKQICRLHLNSKQKTLVLLDDPDKKEDKILITELEDIYIYKERLLNTIKQYIAS
jgi:hypothetical protein